MINYRKFLKTNFIKKIAKTRVIQILITIPLTLKNMKQPDIKPRRSHVERKNLKNYSKKLEKIAVFFKKLFELVILKS